ncbi:type II toxin-antitoxin system RelE/ParE family toxin [Roseivirga pacifica]|uniref:type II toxin-antitoxin system RelE/ParE family toxin n=1 Tax=Roseivirga pacifica TaxID=1267423 RepID=UPI00227B8734|nr:type II toxin-antitoxin system RelE/ParE family toxin [Roseivirga pacifica]
MEDQESIYQIIITQPAYDAFFEIAEYLYAYYPDSKADEITNQLFEKVSTLKKRPQRGAIEPRLAHRSFEYRFILFQRHRRADIKIIYFIDKKDKTVYIADFFPTEKDDTKIGR